MPWLFPNKKKTFKGCRLCELMYMHCKIMHVYALNLTTAVFVLCAEEIEKRLTAYRRGSKIWRMLIFCQVREKQSQHTHIMTRNETVSAPERISSVCRNNTSLLSQFDYLGLMLRNGCVFRWTRVHRCLSLSVQRAVLLVFCFFEFDVM